MASHPEQVSPCDCRSGEIRDARLLRRTIARCTKLDDWRPWQLSKGLLRIRARVAAAFMGYPARSLRVAGVTGTDGKTTTTELVAAVLSASGRRVSSISSLGTAIGGERLEPTWHLTTPGPFVTQGLLRWMRRCGSEWAVIEASSHGLAQQRLGGVGFHVGVMTNLAPEHLDYHRDMDRYAAAKELLFREIPGEGPGEGSVVLNRDDHTYDRFSTLAKGAQVSYGLSQEADVRASAIDLTTNSSTFTIHTPAKRFQATLALPGLFNVYNALAAVAVGYSQGIGVEAMEEGLRSVARLKGRMFPIVEGQPYSVVIDHAHTPRALGEALRFFRERVQGRIIVVFGCPGERWPGKRIPMGEAAGRLADHIVVTREDDRSESVFAIMGDIAEGLRRAGRHEKIDYIMLPDRREAIVHACAVAEEGDLVLVAGKGHEGTLNVKGRDLPWDEEAVARSAIRSSAQWIP